MDLNLRGKVVLIAGATGTLGRAATLQFAREGARLALLARDAGKLALLAGEVQALGAAAGCFAADLTNAASCDAAVHAAIAHCGRLDVLVACAGAAQGGAFLSLSDADWQRNLELKLFGSIRLLRAALPQLLVQRAGRVVLVIGNSGRLPEPHMLPGAVANAALLAMVRGLAEELGPQGVSINAVNPGPVRSARWTRMMADAAATTGSTVAATEAPFLAKSALRRLAEPEEIAQHVVFLASEAAAHMTGTWLTIDGGSTKSA